MECVALAAAPAPESPGLPPLGLLELDPEALAFRAAALRLAEGAADEVDARIRERALSLSRLRMDLDSPDVDAEIAKETERARLGSNCIILGEQLPETRRFHRPAEARP